MGKIYDALEDELIAWIGAQHMFFVATAPLAGEGHVNVSPKGLDSLRVLGPKRVAYLDLTGSGAETIAHLRENGRIVLMFCAFEGKPRILRLHGRGEVVRPRDARWPELAAALPTRAGARSIIDVQIRRIGTSCGYAIPKLTFGEDRDVLDGWTEKKGPEGLIKYRAEKNRTSLDGLPAIDDE